MTTYDRNRDPMLQNGGMVPVDMPSERDQLRQARLALQWLAWNKLGHTVETDMHVAFPDLPEHVRDALKTSLFQA